MVLVSALTVGGVVLISGQKQYDEQNYGLLDIHTLRIQEEIIRYYDELDQLSLLLHKIPLSEITSNYTKAMARNNRELRILQIFSKSGTLISTETFQDLPKVVDSLDPKFIKHPLILGKGRMILPPVILTHDGVPLKKSINVMRVKIDMGDKYIILGVDLLNHFKNFKVFQDDGAELIIFDPIGNIIYHPNPIKQLSVNHNINYTISEEFPTLGSGNDDFFLNGRKTNRSLIEHRKELVYLFYRRVEYRGLFIAGIVYTVPIISLPSFIRSFDSKQLILILIIICVLPLLSWSMLKYLFSDLKEITHKAQLYTNGEHDILIDVHSQDEIGVLALTFQGMVRQVNERTRYLRKSERRIREARDQAEQALSSKSHLLEDLRQQKAEIERVSKDKDDLLAIVSHDLKNPLAVIETSMDVIMEEKEFLTEVISDLIRRSKNSARTALDLITDLLDLARLEGGIKLSFEKFSVNKLIENVVDSYYLNSSKKNIIVEVHNDGDFCLIADYGRVVQVLSNILGNALKFTPVDGRIDIYVESYETAQGYEGLHQGLQLRIKDTGPGIPENKLESIFNKFEQARANDRKIGTGLGLAIVKNICELHNGDISVCSTEGEGSTFTIHLPRLILTRQDEQLIADESAKVIFIANNDELHRRCIKKILNDDSYEVAEATNGEEVLLYLDKHTPDLMILGHKMPVKNGVDALKDYTDKHLTNIPVILLSNSLPHDDSQWVRDHIYDILPEDASPIEIENRVISILNPNGLTSLDKNLDEDKKTILIVDDEEDLRAFLQDTVLDIGYNCILAKGGVEALFLMEKYRIDLVISDIRMSEGDGLSLAKAIKKKFPSTPVALMSAMIDGISDNVIKKIGIVSLITKPFDIDEFCDHIYSMIGDPSLDEKAAVFRDRGDSPEQVQVSIKTDDSSAIAQKNANERIRGGDNQVPKILLVDDSEDMQMLFKLLLRKENIELDIVSSGEEALESIRSGDGKTSYNAIFMDLNMPGINGDEATVLIRQWESSMHLSAQHIVLLSASSEDQALALMGKGFDSFIQKPINKEKILQEIKMKRVS